MRDRRALAGLAYALAAYLAWGVSPVYFKALVAVPPLEILAHRVVWSVVLLAALLAASGRMGAVRRSLAEPRRIALLAGTAALISVNWFLYIWAVNTGRLLEASLGYFVNPLANVLLGVVFLRETLGRWQRVAVALAAAGVAVLLVRLGTFPWLSLALATSFAFYGLVRKRAGIDALGALLVETAVLAPLALAFLSVLGASGRGAFGSSAGTTALLVAAGAITALPLLWFGHAVQRLRLSTVGLVQYVAPTAQFLLAILVYREPFGSAHALAFACIWVSLAIYSADTVARSAALSRAAGPG
jgi:chloramphenicol-sensitive protein RarD